jgi:C-terminal processing protease CtpA/Prc
VNKKIGVFLFCFALALQPALAAPGDEPARRLTPRGLENLEAFTRLLGYVRFFHPSDQAAAANWHQVAIAGVQEAEKAVNPADLARTLEDFFRPLAPTLRVYPDGNRPAVPGELSPPSANAEVIFWEHRGVTLGSGPSPYSSQRSTALATPPASTGLPVPAQPLEVSLGGGVSALLPLTLYRDSGGTLPRTSEPAPSPDKPGGWAPSGNDRATRLAGIAIAWSALQHFFPYFDVVPTDWPSELRKGLTAAAKDRNELAFLTTARRLSAALHDGHADVFHSVRRQGFMPRVTWDWIEDKLVITHAEAGGLRHGDVVLSINGKPTRQVIAAEEPLVSAATPQWRRWATLQYLLEGNRNDLLRLKVQRARGGVANVAVPRTEPIFSDDSFRERRPEKISEIRPGLWYVDLDRINDADFRGAVNQLAAARGVIFDMRGHPTRLSGIVFQHLLSQEGRAPIFNVPYVTRPDRQGMRFEDRIGRITPASPRITGRVVFITDGRAISAAESFMAIVEAYRLGEIVGSTTAGTNGNVNTIRFPGNYFMGWTGMQVLKHDGSRYHGVGVQPTVPVSRTLKGVAEGRDELLEKAIEVGGTL